MNKKEKETFLELCKFCATSDRNLKNLIEKGYATSEVLGELFANRMAGAAYGTLKETDLLQKTNREFRNSLYYSFIVNKKINEDYAGCVNFVTQTLEACGARYALLKGAYLCFWYPKGYRISNDIDILVAPEDVGKVSASLKLAGFKQGEVKNGVFIPATREQIIESKMTRGETVPFIKEIKLPYIKHLEVDLNFSLDYKNGNDNVLKEMLSRTRLVELGSVKMRTLDPVDFLLHLCVHLYKEATTMPWIRMKRDMTLYKYCDIYAMLNNFNGDFESLLERAKANSMEKELSYCINSVQSLFAVKYDIFADLLSNDYSLDDVVSPREKKIYRYRESDPVKRFFSKDRTKLLEETGKCVL